jgi:hypothetical protein
MAYSQAILLNLENPAGAGNLGVTPSHRSGSPPPIWLARFSTGLRLRFLRNVGNEDAILGRAPDGFYQQPPNREAHPAARPLKVVEVRCAMCGRGSLRLHFGVTMRAESSPLHEIRNSFLARVAAT